MNESEKKYRALQFFNVANAWDNDYWADFLLHIAEQKGNEMLFAFVCENYQLCKDYFERRDCE